MPSDYFSRPGNYKLHGNGLEFVHSKSYEIEFPPWGTKRTEKNP